MKTIFAALLCLTLLCLSCSSEKAEKQAPSTEPTADNSMLKSAHGEPDQTGGTSIPATSMVGATIAVAGISVTAPADWKNLGPSGMRQGNFTFGPLEGETDSATVGIFYFGQNQGGSVSENVSRWLGQMTTPSGDLHSEAEVTKETYNGITVHLLSILGTYNASMGGPMSGNTVPKENYLMSGAIVEAPDGLVFFKLTGPIKTATQMNQQLRAMVSQLKVIG
jgi:hypothetical protein